MIGEYKIIAFCLSRIHDPSSHSLAEEINKALCGKGYRVFVYNTLSDLYWKSADEYGEASVFELMDFSVIDSVVIFNERLKNEEIINKIITRAKACDTPVILIDSQEPNDCINVRFDYESGFERIVEHIVCGHKIHNVHFISGIEGNTYSEKRTEVFKRVMRDNDIEVTDDMISYGQFWSGPTNDIVENLISEKRVPRAIICANDSMAIAACETLRRHGYSVPHDVAVTGFDGIDEALFCQPSITTCKCSFSSIARVVSELLPQCENNGLRKGEYMVAPELIIGDSCGCGSGHSTDFAEYITRVSNRFHRYQEEEHSLMKLGARLQTSENFAHAAECLKQYNKEIYNTYIMLNQRCIDSTLNLLDLPEYDSYFDEKMYLFLNSDFGSQDESCHIMRSEIVPGLDTKLKEGYPLIFTALNFSNIPLGYICFSFYNYDIANYYKIPQTCSILNNAISGLHNLQYVRFLAKKIEQTYRIDALTGLNNRMSLTKEFDRLVSALKPHSCITVVMAVLDRLKYINDTFGHEEGDVALRAVADALKHACPAGAVLARFGGDEMLGIITSETDRYELRSAVDGYLSEHNAKMGKPYTVSASLGVYVTAPDEELSLEELVKKTDRLMYNEKSRKKAMYAKMQTN